MASKKEKPESSAKAGTPGPKAKKVPPIQKKSPVGGADVPLKTSAAAKTAGAKAAPEKAAKKSPAKTAAKKPIVAAKAAPKKAVTASAAKKTAAPKAAPAAKAAAKPKAAAKKPAPKAPAKRKAPAKPTVRKLTPESAIKAPAPTVVRELFFAEHHAPESTPADEREIPLEYGDTKVVLLVRDPEWVYCYWEINDETRRTYGLSRTSPTRRIVLRLYKIDGRNWPEEAAHYFFDVEIAPYSRDWYVHLPETAATWCAELGTFTDGNDYICIARSNVVTTPRDRLSEEVDPDWMTVDARFKELYGMSGGLTLREMRGSEEILRHLEKQVESGLSGANPTSGALFSGSVGPLSPVTSARHFWLQVRAELVLFGATEPDATVTVQGHPVRLAPDGTFSLRFSLPDGEQVLQVRATNSEGTEERIVTPVVRKNTK